MAGLAEQQRQPGALEPGVSGHEVVHPSRLPGLNRLTAVANPAWQAPTRPLVAIPAWNEAGSVASVVEHVREALPLATVLVVNDGSTDDTEDLVAMYAGYGVQMRPR